MHHSNSGMSAPGKEPDSYQFQFGRPIRQTFRGELETGELY